jgi:hypothetical protein
MYCVSLTNIEQKKVSFSEILKKNNFNRRFANWSYEIWWRCFTHSACSVKLYKNAGTWQIDKNFQGGSPLYDRRSLSGYLGRPSKQYETDIPLKNINGEAGGDSK